MHAFWPLTLVSLLPAQQLVVDVWPGITGMGPPQWEQVARDGRGGLLLTGNDGIHGRELFVVSRSGLAAILDLRPGSLGSNPGVFWSGDDVVFVSALDATGTGRLWRMDPTTHALVVVSTAVESPDERLVRTGDSWVFRGRDLAHGAELWRTDGTAPGTYLVRDIEPGGWIDGSPRRFASSGQRAMFAQLTFLTVPWITDGMTATRLASSSLNNPSSFLALASHWLFVAGTPAAGYELWTSDETPLGTHMLVEVNPGAATGVVSELVRLGAGALFLGDGPGLGIEPWWSDGTASGTRLVADVNPGPASSCVLGITGLVPAGDGVWMTLTDGVHGTEPWFTNGTAAGTFMPADICPGCGASIRPFVTNAAPPMYAVGLDRTIVFVADTGTTGNEIWVSDGTAAGTFPLNEILPGLASAEPRDFLRVGPNVFFTADDGIHGRELWALPTAATKAAVTETVSPPCTGGLPHPQITSQSTPRVGNQAFAIGVAGALANSFAGLFASFDVQEQQFGGCTLWPETTGMFAATMTDGNGVASLSVPIPALPFLAGVQLWLQWGIVRSGGPMLGLVDPSDALFVQIGK